MHPGQHLIAIGMVTCAVVYNRERVTAIYSLKILDRSLVRRTSSS